VNTKLWVCVIMGVLVAHIAVLIIVANIRTAGKPPPKPSEPTFETSTTTYTDARGETRKVVHEFTVQTELAPPDVLEKLPAPPAPDAVQTAKNVAPAAAN
jgi:hypothetical protein